MRAVVGFGSVMMIGLLSLACAAGDSATVGVSSPTDVPPEETPTPVPAPAPIVLLHGMAGFNEIGGIAYWVFRRRYPSRGARDS